MTWLRSPMLIALAVGCGTTGDTAPQGTPPAKESASDPDPTSAPIEAPSPETDAAAPAIDGVLAWLDPDAVAAAAIALPKGIEYEALVAVFAIPPRGEELLKAAAEVDRWLATFVSDQTPPDTWLGDPALSFTSAFSSSPTVIRPLTKPRDEVAAILAAGEFSKQTIEGFEIWYPKKAFPFRIALLDANTVAFIPAREPGSGLSPLTAGRDLPASDLQKQLEKAYQDAPNLYVELYAAGPMMHFDLDPPLVGARFELLPFETGGVEGRVLLQPERDAAASVDVLEARSPAGESDRIVELAKAVAFDLDGAFVVGVLQLRAQDVVALGGP